MAYNSPSGSPFLSILGGLAKGYQQRQQADAEEQQAYKAKQDQDQLDILGASLTNQPNFLKYADYYRKKYGADKDTSAYLEKVIAEAQARQSNAPLHQATVQPQQSTAGQGGGFGGGGGDGGFGQWQTGQSGSIGQSGIGQQGSRSPNSPMIADPSTSGNVHRRPGPTMCVLGDTGDTYDVSPTSN